MKNEKAIRKMEMLFSNYDEYVPLSEIKDILALLAEPEKPKREQIIEDNPEENELPAILRDYSDTDDLIPKPVLEKVAERMEDLEGAINNILKHEPEKPTCSMCGGSGRMPESRVIDGKPTSQNCLHRPECDINTVNHECKCTCDGPKPMPCPDCPKPKEDVAEFIDTCPSYMGQGKCNEAEDYAKLEAENKELKAIIESQERNDATSEIIIGDLTKKIEGMEAKL